MCSTDHAPYPNPRVVGAIVHRGERERARARVGGVVQPFEEQCRNDMMSFTISKAFFK